MGEDIWQNLPYKASTSSVFEGGWPKHLMNFPLTDVKEWELILKVRDDVNKMLEVARADKVLGASLEGAAFLFFSDHEKKDILLKFVGDVDLIFPPVKTNGVDELRTALMLSEVHILEKESDIVETCDVKYVSSGPMLSGCVIGITKATGKKCERCWFYDSQVGKHGLPHTDICQRCNIAIDVWEKHTGNKFVQPSMEIEEQVI
jgi:isoleucyl-tRNA synthetase